MTLSTLRRTLAFAAVAVALPVVLVGCPKKEAPAVPDTGAPAPPASTPEMTELAPLVDEAGAEAEAAAPKKYAGGGGGMTGNQVKIKACCNAMRTQAKTLGSSPEAFQITSAAAMCDQFASQVGASGSAPEFAQIRGMLKSVTLPAACSF